MRRKSAMMRLGVAAATLASTLLAAASPAAASTSFEWIEGFDAADTPDSLDRVGVLEVGPKHAPNVLVLNPGTSASAAYFRPLARFIASETKGWQVWSVERRENRLEDQSVVDEAKQGTATTQRLFDLLPRLPDRPERHRPLPVRARLDGSLRPRVGHARRGRGSATRGQKAEREAGERGGEVVLGGHSLGGSITTAYATWDFHGRPGAKGLAGLVYIDGGSSPDPISPEEASQLSGTEAR